MAPETRGVVHATQVWLQSSWHVQVPFDWLEACVEWLQEEAGGGGQLSQQHINQQVLDQWLQTDLRVLGHPVLPDGLSQAQKTELSGTFIVQVDSLLDISQPAYGQLQKWRGKDCSNEEVSAVTQTTQKPWEAKPTRMLLLQVTDGVQSLEAMEYQPIAALNTSLRPGLKLQLQGQMVCRLGVLLLGPQNVKVLGGEVEDLMERNKQGRVLCRALGLPEEEHQTEGAQQEVNEGDPPAPQQGDHGFEDFDIDDEELLVSLEAQEELDRAEHQHSLDTGYGTLTEDSSVSYRGSSVRSQASTASSRRESSSQRQSLAQASGRSLGQGNHRRNDQDYSALVNPPSSTLSSQHNATSHNAADENFPDEDFDDLVLDELDGVVLQESSIQTRGQPDSRHDNRRLGHNGAAPGRREAVTSDPSFHLRASIEAVHLPDDRDFMDDDLDFCFPEETEEIENRGKDVQGGFKEHDRTLGTFQTLRASTSDASVLQEGISLGSKNDAPQSLCQARDGKRSVPSKSEASDFNYRLSIQSSARPADKSSTKTAPVSESIPQAISHVPRAAESAGLSLEKETPRDGTITAPSLTSPPFTYLCLLRGKTPRGTVIRMKAFIVTLLGKLTSNTGAWRVFATISDGTGYLDVELSDQVLSAMLGFSVAEKGAMKRDPSRRAELNAGMRRCQEELVDMCCVMTVLVEAPPKKAVVLKVDPVTEEDLRALEHRMKKRKR